MSQDDQMDGAPVDGEGGASPLPADEDVKIGNTGQRVRAILVALIALGGAGAGVWYFVQQDAAIKRHEAVEVAFQQAHTKGYAEFWAASQIDVKEMKSNEDFTLRVKQIISEGPSRYGKHVKEKCLPLIDEALPLYKGIAAPSDYADKLESVVKASEGMRTAWGGFSDELLNFEQYSKGREQLDKVANAWLGSQTSTDAKFVDKSMRYHRLLSCILPDKKLAEIEATELNSVISASCDKGESAWFRRVAFECIPGLQEKTGEMSEDYKATIEAFRKAERPDHASKFGIEDCLKKTQDYVEEEMIEKIALSWRDYIKTKNDLVKTVDETLAALR